MIFFYLYILINRINTFICLDSKNQIINDIQIYKDLFMRNKSNRKKSKTLRTLETVDLELLDVKPIINVITPVLKKREKRC